MLHSLYSCISRGDGYVYWLMFYFSLFMVPKASQVCGRNLLVFASCDFRLVANRGLAQLTYCRVNLVT